MLLPECQFEIMSAIWQATADHGSAFFRDLFKYGSDHLKMRARATLYMELQWLRKKGFIRTERMNDYMNRLVPLVSEAEYRSEAYKDLLSCVFRGNRVELARLLLNDMTAEELEKARQLLI